MCCDGKRKEAWVQCTNCGRVYQTLVSDKTTIEDMYIIDDCPNCGVITTLNLGENEEDKYLYYDVNLDASYYNY